MYNSLSILLACDRLACPAPGIGVLGCKTVPVGAKIAPEQRLDFVFLLPAMGSRWPAACLPYCLASPSEQLRTCEGMSYSKQAFELTQAGLAKAVNKQCGQLIKDCCTAVDSACDTGFWDRAQQLWRQAAQEARGLAGEGGADATLAHAVLLGWQRRRDALIPQLQYTVRAARCFRLAGSAVAAGGAAAASGQQPTGVPVTAVEREIALARVRCANPLCTHLGDESYSATEKTQRAAVLRCRGCAVAGYCGWVPSGVPGWLGVVL
jgi:hypothetical protein